MSPRHLLLRCFVQFAKRPCADCRGGSCAECTCQIFPKLIPESNNRRRSGSRAYEDYSCGKERRRKKSAPSPHLKRSNILSGLLLQDFRSIAPNFSLWGAQTASLFTSAACRG